MYLSKEEESILAGERGEAWRTAMRILVDVGDFFEAEKMIDIESSHISGVSYLTGGEALIEQLSSFVKLNAKVSVPSTLNPCGMDREKWKNMRISDDFAKKQFEILNYFKSLEVVTTCSCTPYDFSHILHKGQHVAWAESSAVSFANTFFGARTNKEDSISVLSSAITGKTPFYGFHIAENRIPNVVIDVGAEIDEYTKYSYLGEFVGKAFKSSDFEFGAIPCFRGIEKPRPQEIKALGASLASFGVQMYHIEGVTPEQELVNQAEFTEELNVSENDIEEIYHKYRPDDAEDIKIVVIGCPNANLEEVVELSKIVENKEVSPGKELWIYSSRAVRGIAKGTGYLEKLENAGVKFFVDTCPEVMPYNKKEFTKILTNSMKAQHYISAPSLNSLPTYVLPLRECVERICVKKENERENEK